MKFLTQGVARWFLLATVLVAGVAVANRFNTAALFIGGINVGPAALATTTNRVTRILATAATIDFVSGVIVCTDSANVTLTGAQVGDLCLAGPAAATSTDNSVFTCLVTAADTVKVRHCPVGTAADPASASYIIRVISTQ